MTPEETFRQLLGLGKGWRVIQARLESSSSTFVLKVEETAALWPAESVRAGTSVTCHDQVEPTQWRHLNIFNKECVICCAVPRGRRGDDGRVYRVTPPWEGRIKHFAEELEAFAVNLMREMPVWRAGDFLGMSHARMVWMRVDKMRLVVHAICEWMDVGDARRLLLRRSAWVHSIRSQVWNLLESMAPAARMIETHFKGTLLPWTRGLKSPFMEAPNSLFAAVKRHARGHRTVEYMTAMLYLVAGINHLSVLPTH